MNLELSLLSIFEAIEYLLMVDGAIDDSVLSLCLIIYDSQSIPSSI